MKSAPPIDMNELPPVDYADIVPPAPANIPSHRGPGNIRTVSIPPRQSAPAASAAKLYLKVENEAQRDRCLPILTRTPGAIPVTFYVTSLKAAFRADGYSVSGNVDLKALADLLGEKNVVMK